MITKEKSEAIIKSLTNEIPDICPECGASFERGILIGDVLEKFDRDKWTEAGNDAVIAEIGLLSAWKACGSLSISLQSILSGAKWEKKEIDQNEVGDIIKREVLSSPASELFEMLDTFTI